MQAAYYCHRKSSVALAQHTINTNYYHYPLNYPFSAKRFVFVSYVFKITYKTIPIVLKIISKNSFSIFLFSVSNNRRKASEMKRYPDVRCLYVCRRRYVLANENFFQISIVCLTRLKISKVIYILVAQAKHPNTGF